VSLGEWRALFDTIQSFVSIQVLIEQCRFQLPIFEQVRRNLFFLAQIRLHIHSNLTNTSPQYRVAQKFAE
jgi:hypothetical protein